MAIDGSDFSAEGCRNGDGGSVGAAPSQGCDSVFHAVPLETCHDDNVEPFQFGKEMSGFYGNDTRGAIRIIRQNRHLIAYHGTRLHARIIQKHTEKGDGLLFPRREQRIIFRRIRFIGPLIRHFHKLIGLSRTGRENDNNFIPLCHCVQNLCAHFFHAKFLNQYFHAFSYSAQVTLCDKIIKSTYYKTVSDNFPVQEIKKQFCNFFVRS